jgi:hypothetical protein
MGSKNKDATRKSVAMITQVFIETEKKLSLFVVFAPLRGRFLKPPFDQMTGGLCLSNTLVSLTLPWSRE